MNKDRLFTDDKHTCGLRSAGVLIKDNMIKNNSNVLIGWLSVDELKNVTIYPTFLKEEIYRLNGEIKHFVSFC